MLTFGIPLMILGQFSIGIVSLTLMAIVFSLTVIGILIARRARL